MTFFDLFDKFAGVCKKLCYIMLCVIMLMILSDRVRADDSETTGMSPAVITVQAETDEVTGESKVTIYIRAFINDVQSKYHELVDTPTNEATDDTEAPKPS